MAAPAAAPRAAFADGFRARVGVAAGHDGNEIRPNATSAAAGQVLL